MTEEEQIPKELPPIAAECKHRKRKGERVCLYCGKPLKKENGKWVI